MTPGVNRANDPFLGWDVEDPPYAARDMFQRRDDAYLAAPAGSSDVALEVVDVPRDDIVYPFDRDPPYVRVGRSKYQRQRFLDPTPAYGHDAALTEQVLREVARTLPVGWPVGIWLLPAEEVTRTNGATNIDSDADYDAPKDADGNYPTVIRATIHFSAKRIPIHPAMTRYLVGHEYGHVVEEWLNKTDGDKLWGGTLMKAYAALRGMEQPKSYGAGVWHCTPGEVFANDFRILVCGLETEFWPHPGIPRPEEVGAVREWWDTRMTANS